MRDSLKISLMLAGGALLLAGWIWLLKSGYSHRDESFARECDTRFAGAHSYADTLRILDTPQGPRAIYCGAYLAAPLSRKEDQT